MSDRVKAKGILTTPLNGNVVYDEKKQGTSLFGGRKNKYYKDGKKVAVVKSKVKKKNGDFSTKTKVRVTKNANLLNDNPVVDREKDTMTMKKGPMYKYDSMAKMNSYDKDMMHERELISDAEKEIHKEDVAKKKHMHVVSRIAGRNSR